MVLETTTKSKVAEKQAYRPRRVFLFEQSIIFSEEIERKRNNNLDNPGCIYKNSIKVGEEEEDINSCLSLFSDQLLAVF